MGFTELATKTWRFAVGGLRAHHAFRDVQRLGFGDRIRGHAPFIRNQGTIEFGDYVFFDAPVTPACLDVEEGALLRVGASSYFNDAVWIGVTQSVTLGERVRVAPGVRIIDNAYHGLEDRRSLPPSEPVVIEDDVWLSSDCMINPGVHIGRGAVVGAHSLVTKDVAAFTVVAGVPAREIGKVDRAQFELALARRQLEHAGDHPLQ